MHVQSSLSELVAHLHEGSSTFVGSASSAQLDFAKLRNPIERAILTREVSSATEIASFESGMQQFLADLEIVHKRMLGAPSDGQIGKAKALAESWFAAAVSFVKPSANGVQELPTPIAFVAMGDEAMSAIDRVVEAANADESGFSAQAEASAMVSRDNLILINALAVIAAVIAAIGTGMVYSLGRDELGGLLGSLAKSQSALREMNETRERERAEQLAAFHAQVEADRQRRRA
jgi:hypothetical protein